MLKQLQEKIKNAKKIKNIKNFFTEEEYLFIVNFIKYFNQDLTFREIKYCILSEIRERPKCQICGKDIFYDYSINKFPRYCSFSCFKSKKAQKNSLEKRKKSMKAKYGTEHALLNDELKNKFKETNIKKFGVENPFSNEKIKEKIKKTNLERYGVEYPIQNKEIKEKIKKTNLERYGVENPFSDIDLQNKIKDKANKINSDMFTSKPEIELYENIKKIVGDEIEIKQNYRIYDHIKKHTREIDIFLPSFNLGIEFCGLYWHSDIKVDKNYHREKYDFFKSQGIDLIQIFETEWNNNKNIVLSIIKTKLGKTDKRIMARKCKIKELSNKEYKEFINLNHLQGYSSAKIRIGLIYNEEIVQVLSLSSPRFNKKYDYEIIRNCTKINTIVIGGFRKLLNYFEKKYCPKNIITYVDLRYFNGHSYINNGFKIAGKSKPDYFYFKTSNIKNKQLYNRLTFQKHKLKILLENFNENMSEYKNMLNNGYFRIYDTGNLILIKEYN